jgi:tRNA threonylcarbamoyladenosine biosynthesis protein TsaE
MEIVFVENDLPWVASQIIRNADSRILCFYGEMGAGKTTVIKALVLALGGGSVANSPTFGIVNEYETEAGSLMAYHFDFYRIADESEALDLGVEDYWSRNVWVFIEWPEHIETLLPPDCVKLQLETIDERTRKISF